MQAFNEIGFRKTARYVASVFLLAFFRVLGFSPLRILFLRVFGAKIGKNCIIHGVKFFNWYRGSFRNFFIADNVFIGDDCMFDLADHITLETHTTLAERVMVLTHMNVGYKDHPLQKHFPSQQAPVVIQEGSFLGVSVTVLSGVTIGTGAFVAAGSVVTKDIAPHTMVGGVPAKEIRKIT